MMKAALRELTAGSNFENVYLLESWSAADDVAVKTIIVFYTKQVVLLSGKKREKNNESGE